MKMSVSLFYGDTEYVVTGNYRKRVPARMYLRNGDPGYPEEPAEFEIEDVTVCDQSIMEMLQCCWTKDGKHILDDMEVECLEKVDD
jgi:hypothetical protein